ncbi:MAG: class I SAM-dependent methyltransferase, partial [Pseudomonadales bacterium]|nr:class I SAM-dependent methyltransferase [Pseudomonadales bacterium]
MPAQNAKTRSKSADELSASFGYRPVDSEEKQPLVNDVFHKVAGRYDVMNDLMSGGMHRIWKDAMISRLAPPKRPGSGWHGLDVAGGTGDIAFGILEAANRNVHATVLDINASMLEVGKKRAVSRKLDGLVDFVEADAQKLPFGDNAFD